ncbi:MAG: Ger(x)C family spore germination protein [Clostridia bacterium]|nr:Ger(x)C family spore germination protein [Clostridia bacterium]
MIRRNIICFFYVVFLFVLPGCWDYRDLDELSIPSVGMYDLQKGTEKKEGDLNVAGIIPVLYSEADKKYRIEYITAKTVGETREKRSSSSPDSYFPGSLQVGIFGENLARQGIKRATDILFRVSKIKDTIYMAVLEGDIKDLEKIEMKEYPNPGVYLLGLLRKAHKDSFLITTTLYLFEVQRITTGKNPVIPLIKMSNNNIVISGTGIFKNDKMIAKIDLKDTRSLVLLRGGRGKGRIPFIINKDGKKVDEGTVDVKSSRKVKVIREGNNFTFFITVKLQGRLMEHYSQRFIIDEKPNITGEEIERAVKKAIEKDCREFVKKMQEEFKVDCLDITKYALAKWRNELQDKVEDGFIENVDIVVDVDVVIKEIGELT